MQTGFQRVSFFIALKNSPLINLIFQKRETPREAFYIGRYHFTLYQNLQHADVCRYVVRRGSLHYYFSFLGIDSIIECDTKSNVDFIHFVWRNVEAQYPFRRHAITLFPDEDGFILHLLCIRIMTCQVSGGPSARAVVFAVLRLETRHALSPAAWHRLKLVTVSSAHGVPLPESPGFQCIFYPGAQYRAFQADAARYLFTVSCHMRLRPS